MKRYKFTANLELPLGFYTGTGDYSEATDNPILTDEQGNPYLPGSSIAGVLRTEMERIAPFVFGKDHKKCVRTDKDEDCDCQVCRLMGIALGKDAKEGTASRLVISTSHPSCDSNFNRKIRDRVGIERDRMTAAYRKKYDVELLEGKICFPIEMILEMRDPPVSYGQETENILLSIRKDEEFGKEEEEAFNDNLKLLFALFELLKLEPLFVGGHSSRGTGYARMKDIKVFEINTGTEEGFKHFKEFLLSRDVNHRGRETELPTGLFNSEKWILPVRDKKEDPWEKAEGKTPDKDCLNLLEIEYTLSGKFQFLVNDPIGAAMEGVDHVTMKTANGKAVLPGSSIRGVLRSRAEKIMRTFGKKVCDIHVNKDPKASEKLCCHAKIRDENKKLKLEKMDPLKSEEEWDRFLCVACRLFGCGRRKSNLMITNAYSDKGYELKQDFVAIDRFTGGARAGAKFDAQPMLDTQFEGKIILKDFEKWQVGVLALLIKDLRTDRLRFGFGSSKGYGQLKLTNMKVNLHYINDPDMLEITGQDNGDISGTIKWEMGESYNSYRGFLENCLTKFLEYRTG